MKLIVVLLALIALSCAQEEYLTVEETVRQCQVCEESGLFSDIHTDWTGKKVVSVTCETYRYRGRLPDYATIKTQENNGKTKTE